MLIHYVDIITVIIVCGEIFEYVQYCGSDRVAYVEGNESRCLVDDIVNTVAITAIQAQQAEEK